MPCSNDWEFHQAVEQLSCPGRRQDRNYLTQQKGKPIAFPPEYFFSTEEQIPTCLCRLELLRPVLPHCWKASSNPRDASSFLKAPRGPWQPGGASTSLEEPAPAWRSTHKEWVWNCPRQSCQHRRVSGSCSELKNSCQVRRMGPKSSWFWQHKAGKAGHTFIPRPSSWKVLDVCSLLGNRLALARGIQSLRAWPPSLSHRLGWEMM